MIKYIIIYFMGLHVKGDFMEKKAICDSHVHSSCSSDADNTVDELCSRAAGLGLCSITVTDHCEANFYDDPQNSEFGDFSKKIPQSVKEVKEAQVKYDGKLRVYCGIELGEPMQNLSAAQRALSLADFDFVLASVHNISGEQDFYWLDYREDTIEELLRRYFNEVLLTARWNHFDSLAHLTYPLRYIKKKLGTDVDLGQFRGQTDMILRTLAVNKKALEVNASGLRQEIGKTLPDREVIARFRELGGEYVTVGSDAHNTEDLAKGIDQAIAVIKECGFTHYTVYEKHRPTFIAL